MGKWTAEHHANFKKTMAEKRRAMLHERRQLKKKHTKQVMGIPVFTVTNGKVDAQEFAEFMVSAWKALKGK